MKRNSIVPLKRNFSTITPIHSERKHSTASEKTTVSNITPLKRNFSIITPIHSERKKSTASENTTVSKLKNVNSQNNSKNKSVTFSDLHSSRGRKVPMEKSYHQRFPIFQDSNLFEEFTASKNKGHNNSLCLSLIVFILAFFFARFNIESVFSRNVGLNGIFSVVFGFTSILLCICIIVKKSFKLYGFKVDVVVTKFIKNFAVLSGVIAVGLSLYSRSLSGDCHEQISNINLWNSQQCNTAASLNSVPTDHVLFLCLSPIIYQLLVPSTTLRVNIICWCIAIVFYIISLVHVGGSLETLTAIEFSLSLFFVIEHERIMRIKFLYSIESKKYFLKVTSLEEKVDKMKFHRKLQSKINSSRRYSSLMKSNGGGSDEIDNGEDLPQQQVIAVINGMAHDIRTPLQSIRTDIEILSDIVSSLPEDDSKNIDAVTSIETLGISCDFLTMSINR